MDIFSWVSLYRISIEINVINKQEFVKHLHKYTVSLYIYIAKGINR